MKYALLALLFASSLAHAKCGDETVRSFQGEDADGLAYVMKHSELTRKFATPKNLTLSLNALDCTQVARSVTQDGMHDYNCDVPVNVRGLPAKLFFDTLSSLGIFADAGMSQVHLEAKSIVCTVAEQSDAAATNPTCTVTAQWASDCR